MLSLLARRVSSVTVQAHRTLFATPLVNFPPVKHTTEKKVSKATPAKRGRPVIHKEKKQPAQKVRIPKHLKPPKAAPGPYFIFFASFIKSQPHPTSLQATQELAKRAAEIWRGYSMAERQPFYDENEARKVQAKQEREEFFRNTSLAELKQLNAIRKAQGKYKYRLRKVNHPIASNPFILFVNDFRKNPDVQALINETSPEKMYSVRSMVAAADRWRSMSPEEKEPYFERFRKTREELKAERADA